MSVGFAALLEHAVETGRDLGRPGDPDDPVALYETHVERMHHLAQTINQLDRSAFAEAGLDLVRWLGAVAVEWGRTAHRPRRGFGVHRPAG